MKLRNRFSKLSSLVLTMTLMLSVVQPGLVTPALAQEAADENVAYDPLTGALAFIGTPPGRQGMASPLANASAQPDANAAAFASAYMNELGLNDVAAELTAPKIVTQVSGRSTMRYRQTYQGLDVFGGEVIINTDASGALLSLTAKTSPNLTLDVNPTLTADAATDIALQRVAASSKVSRSVLNPGKAALQIYDSRLLNPDGLGPRLVWNLTVMSLNDGVNAVVLVDAQTGKIALHYNQMDIVTLPPDTATERATFETEPRISPDVLGSPQIGIYNLNHTSPAPNNPAGWPGTFVCNQTNKAACDGSGGDIVDATNAYKNAADAYNFMKNYLKIDSFDNAGVQQKGSIRFGNGYKKNFWVTGVRTAAYGDGYTGADDMAGHAIGFGLLEYSNASALVLAFQPGAIAESLSDIWGEFIDQTNSRGNDTAGVKWLIGEDWPDGVQRSMSNPAASPYNDADKMTSPNFYVGTGDNNGGIYTNAGVNNKAAFLMTDGGIFNGKTVKGLGIAKVARLYYEVEEHLLASASTYFDLYYAIKQACYNLVADPQSNFFAQDCDQVKAALDAVQMNKTKSTTFYPVAQFCPDGKSRGVPIFADGFESGTTNWVISNPTSPSDLWAVLPTDSTEGGFHLATSEASTAGKTIAETANAITIPGGRNVYLFFEHFFNFQTVSSVFRDGGVLYYSSDNGATWKNSSALHAGGQKYNGSVGTGHANPIEGQQAFVGSTMSTVGTFNYVSSSYNLTSLAGSQLKFRWIFASDDADGGTALGWHLDNVQVYPCVSLPAVANLLSPANNALQTNFKPTLDWSDVTPDLDHYIVQVANNSTFTSMAYEAVVTASQATLTKALAANKQYYWRVRAYNAGNDANGWSAVRNFRTSLAAPTLLSPISGTVGSLKPLFDWKDVSAAQGYTIQVSTVSNFSTFAINATISTATSKFTPANNLGAGKTYFWRVRTNGTNGPSAWSAVKSFQTP